MSVQPDVLAPESHEHLRPEGDRRGTGSGSAVSRLAILRCRVLLPDAAGRLRSSVHPQVARDADLVDRSSLRDPPGAVDAIRADRLPNREGRQSYEVSRLLEMLL